MTDRIIKNKKNENSDIIFRVNKDGINTDFWEPTSGKSKSHSGLDLVFLTKLIEIDITGPLSSLVLVGNTVMRKIDQET